MTCPVGLADECPRAERRREDATVTPVSVPSEEWRGRRDGRAPRVPGPRRAPTFPARPRRHGSCHSHGRPRSDAPRIGIRSDGSGRSPGSRVVAIPPPSRRLGRQWSSEVCSPLTVAGAAPASVRRKKSASPLRCSLFIRLPTEPLRNREGAASRGAESRRSKEAAAFLFHLARTRRTRIPRQARRARPFAPMFADRPLGGRHLANSVSLIRRWQDHGSCAMIRASCPRATIPRRIATRRRPASRACPVRRLRGAEFRGATP